MAPGRLEPAACVLEEIIQMKRISYVVVGLACLSPFLAPSPAKAQANELLAAVPADAWGMISVRNLAELDKKLISMGQAANSMMAGMSPLAMAKGMLGLIAGVDDTGGLALVVLPADSFDQIGQRLAILVPTSNYTELLSLTEPEDAGDGVSKVLFRGSESYVAPKGKFAVFGASPELVKAVVQSKTGVESKLTAHQRQRWAADDVTLWVDAAAATSSPVFAPHLEEIKTHGVDTELLTAFKSLQLSLRFGPQGIRIGTYFDAQPDTAMAKAMASAKPPGRPLLTGLPADTIALAFGVALGKEIAAYKAEAADKILQTAAPMLTMVKPEAVSRVRSIFTTLVSRMRTLSFSISVLPEGPDGVVAATKIIGVEGGASAYLASIGELIGVVRSGLILDEEAAAQVKTVLEYQAGAGGAGVDHLALHLDKLEGAQEEDLGMINKIVGKEGLLVRLSAVDDSHVAITLGGGAARMQTVAELVKGNKGPLSEAAEFKKLSSGMPPDRVSEGYLSVDGLMALLKATAKATDGEVPLDLGPVGTPAAMFAWMTGDGGSQTELLIPMELIKALSQAAQAAMMGGPPPAQQPPL
jgi:hypothetical protein